MKRFFAIALISIGALTLSGCQYFYPNWGATSAPTDDPSQEPSNEPSSSSSSEPSPSDSASQTPKSTVELRVLQSNVDSAGGQITVIAEVAEVSEDGGTCTLTVKSGSVTKKISAKAESNVTDTQCYPLNLALAGIPSGTATFTVSYDSADSTGVSSAGSLVIP